MARGLAPNAYRNRRSGCEAHSLQMHMAWMTQRIPDDFNGRLYLGGALFRELMKRPGSTGYAERLNRIHRLYVEERKQREGRLFVIERLV